MNSSAVQGTHLQHLQHAQVWHLVHHQASVPQKRRHHGCRGGRGRGRCRCRVEGQEGDRQHCGVRGVGRCGAPDSRQPGNASGTGAAGAAGAAGERGGAGGQERRGSGSRQRTRRHRQRCHGSIIQVPLLSLHSGAAHGQRRWEAEGGEQPGGAAALWYNGRRGHSCSVVGAAKPTVGRGRPAPLLAAHHLEDAAGDGVQHRVHRCQRPEDARPRPLLGALLQGGEAAAAAAAAGSARGGRAGGGIHT